jgi:hypothetical protein
MSSKRYGHWAKRIDEEKAYGAFDPEAIRDRALDRIRLERFPWLKGERSGCSDKGNRKESRR